MMRRWQFISTTFVAGVMAIAATMPAWAADPFRSSNPKPIGTETQKAFELMFKEGNYAGALKQLDVALRAESSDPLVQAMRASVSFTKGDYLEMKVYGEKTRQKARELMGSDAMRGHLYLGVSNLIEAGYIVQAEGLTSAPKALPLVQKALDELKMAQDMSPSDPEVNLIKGYMDILIASVLPLSDLESALTSLRQYASPDYLKWRGIAMAYRDAGKVEPALDAVNKAIAAAPTNPELNHLKGLILWKKGGSSLGEAREQYLKALTKSKQLPPKLLQEITVECRNLTREMTGRVEECPKQQ